MASRSFSCPCAAVAVNARLTNLWLTRRRLPASLIDTPLPWMRSAIRSEVPITITPIVAIPAMAMDVLLTIEWRQSGAGRVGMPYLVEGSLILAHSGAQHTDQARIFGIPPSP